MKMKNKEIFKMMFLLEKCQIEFIAKNLCCVFWNNKEQEFLYRKAKILIGLEHTITGKVYRMEISQHEHEYIGEKKLKLIDEVYNIYINNRFNRPIERKEIEILPEDILKRIKFYFKLGVFKICYLRDIMENKEF